MRDRTLKLDNRYDKMNWAKAPFRYDIFFFFWETVVSKGGEVNFEPRM